MRRTISTPGTHRIEDRTKTAPMNWAQSGYGRTCSVLIPSFCKKETEIKTETGRETETDRQTDRDRQRQRQTRDRDTDRDRQRDR